MIHTLARKEKAMHEGRRRRDLPKDSRSKPKMADSFQSSTRMKHYGYYKKEIHSDGKPHLS